MRIVASATVLSSAPTSIEIEVDGAPLRLIVGRRVPLRTLAELRRALSGYVRTSAPPRATLTLAGSPGLTVAAELHVAATDDERAHVPFLEPQTFELEEYALFALSEWIDAASLLLGNRSGPRVHAASFVDGDRTWVVVGASNAGKTSLALDAVGRGATYLTDERVTLRSIPPKVVVSGLAQPLRMRGDLADRPASPAARFADDSGTDSFRQLVFCDQFGAVERGWVKPTDLLVLVEEPPRAVDRGWVVRQLVEQCQDAVRIGPDALVDLARLVVRTRVHVSPPRTLRSVLDVGEPLFAPVADDPWLLPGGTPAVGPGTGGSAVRVADGVRTLVMGEECLVWLPGDRASVIGLVGDGALWWRSLAEGEPVPTDAVWMPFVDDLRNTGAILDVSNLADGVRDGA